MSEKIILENDAVFVELLPQFGGRIGRIQMKADSGRSAVEILQPFEGNEFDPLAWPKCGAYPLIPYSNRIEDSCFRFDGHAYCSPSHPAAHPHTLHGVSHTLPWHAQKQSPQSATLGLSYTGPHWPWNIAAEQRFELHDAGITVGLSLTNLDTKPMPGGIGIHPYFSSRQLLKASFNARRIWKINADYLPTGEQCEQNEMTVLTALDWQDAEYVRYLSEWDGAARLDYAWGYLDIISSNALSHLVIFAPQNAPYICLEPVSHLANGFKLTDQFGEKTGIRIIAPGQTLSAQLTLAWSTQS